MQNETEFIRKNKIDILEQLFAEPKKKKKFHFKKSHLQENILVKKVVNNIVETPAMKARKAEIKAIKNEIYNLLTNKESLFMTKDKIYIQNRRAELISCRKVLEAEIGTSQFAHFCS